MGKLFPARESLVSDILAGDRNIAKHFFTVYCQDLWPILVEQCIGIVDMLTVVTTEFYPHLLVIGHLPEEAEAPARGSGKPAKNWRLEERCEKSEKRMITPIIFKPAPEPPEEGPSFLLLERTHEKEQVLDANRERMAEKNRRREAAPQAAKARRSGQVTAGNHEAETG